MVRLLSLFLLLCVLSACAAPAAPTGAPVLPTREATGTPSVVPSATSTPGSPTATPSPTPIVPALLRDYMESPELVAETEHFRIYAQDGYFPVDRAWWLEQVEILYAYVSNRLEGANVRDQIVLGFMPPEQRECPIRGLASHDHPPVVLVFADAQSPRDYLLGVLAHELGHAIPAEGFPGGLPDNLALTEGLATWAAGKYWAAWLDVPDLDSQIRGYIERNAYEPISSNTDLHGLYPWQNSGKDCLARRDKVYAEWGSFLGYLIETYGWEKAHQVFNPPGEPGRESTPVPVPYEQVYGKTLIALEEEWLDHLKRALPAP